MMIANRPLIGVSGPDHGGHAAWLFTRISLFLAGARAVRISPGRKLKNDTLDGLVLGGGADIDPARYGDIRQKARKLKQDLSIYAPGFIAWLIYPLVFVFRTLLSSKSTSSIDKKRDELELGLLGNMVRDNKPVLGICRGAQLINVYFGGTLFQDISEFYTESPNIWSIFPGKTITIKPGTRLAAALGNETQYRVNALHKQAVKDVGNGLEVTATESNNIIQAIEHTDRPFIVGVQWHPEYLLNKSSQRQLFRTLVIKAHENQFPQ